MANGTTKICDHQGPETLSLMTIIELDLVAEKPERKVHSPAALRKILWFVLGFVLLMHVAVCAYQCIWAGRTALVFNRILFKVRYLPAVLPTLCCLVLLKFNLIAKLWSIIADRLPGHGPMVKATAFAAAMGLWSSAPLLQYVFILPASAVLMMVCLVIFSHIIVNVPFAYAFTWRHRRLGIALYCLAMSGLVLFRIENSPLRGPSPTIPNDLGLQDINRLAEKFGMNANDVQVSPHCPLAMYTMGLTWERVLFSENILKTAKPEMLMGVTAHELGHRQNKDLYVRAAGMMTSAVLPVLFAPFAWPELYAAFGFSTEPVGAAFALGQFLKWALGGYSVVAYNALTQYQELRADQMAVKEGFGKGLADYLEILGLENAKNAAVPKDQFVSTLLYDLLYTEHPSEKRRVKIIEESLSK
jgi:Zn-dependent protease with chaperone function